ncbi:MAG: DUF3667 domain-containing protein [Bacteroidota bacterium]
MSEKVSCKSCGNRFFGNYCNLCGEKVIKQGDRKLKHLFSELLNAFTFVESKLWYTLKVMLVRPGKFPHDYVEGRRLKYMRPTSLFFMANLIYFLFPLINTFKTDLEIQLIGFFYSDMAKSMVDGFLAKSALSYEEFELLYNTKTASLSKLLLIVFVLLMALFFAIIHIGSKKKLIADHITVNLELMSFVLLIGIEVMAILISLLVMITQWEFVFSDDYLTVMIMLLLGWYFFKIEQHFYGFKGVRRVLNTALCLASLTATLFLYRALLFFITFWSIT